MGFSIGSVLKAPFQITQAVASAVAPATAGVLKAVAGSVFVAGQMAAGAAAMSGLGLASPLISMGAQALAGGINGAANGMMMPSLASRMFSTGFAGQQGTAAMYSAIGSPYGQPSIASTTFGTSVAQSGPSGISTNPYAAYSSSAATSASATANAGFMPTGSNSLDLANAVANAPTYSPAEQSLLNQITDPKQRAMQELQMQMQQQALLATTLSNLANMRHDSLKAVAQNLHA